MNKFWKATLQLVARGAAIGEIAYAGVTSTEPGSPAVFDKVFSIGGGKAAAAGGVVSLLFSLAFKNAGDDKESPTV